MIDFRSDTVTKPTEKMRQAMANALVGDDVYQDDETVKELERLAALKLGKEAALFIPSGTMGNQIAIMVHTKRGDEIIVGSHAHIKQYEVGAAAVLSQVSFELVDDSLGYMNPKAILNAIRSNDIHYPTTSLICIENAHGSGKVMPLKVMKEIYQIAKDHDLNVHLDGARIFNAALSLNIDVADIAMYADSIMFCLSKGLASPIGSILVGSEAFINRARKYRKMLGGGMRQVGVIAAPGLIALNEMTKRLEEDHETAQYLSTKLKQLDGFIVDESALMINMVFVKTPVDLNRYKDALRKKGFIIGGYKGEYLRLVTHYEITKKAIDMFIEALKSILLLK
ncbi:MAG: low-specificity L-threonine aldolase [Candidatus Izemoplasmataceae bacterium]